jgi:apurinic endonuclease APN1
LIEDQGEVALAIEHYSDGTGPVICGYTFPSAVGATSKGFENNNQKRDAFLAAVNAYNAKLEYKNKKRHKDKKNPNDLLDDFVKGRLDFYEPESEMVLYQQAIRFKECCDDNPEFRATMTQISESLEGDYDTLRSVYTKYKPVALKVRPKLAQLPPEFRVERTIKGDPLEGIYKLNPNPGEFKPMGRFTQERMEVFLKNQDPDFWTPEEQKLILEIMMFMNEAFAWNDEEKGRFDPEMFPPVKMSVVEHTPWVLKNIPIPPGIFEQVCGEIKRKIDSGTYEPSNSSYRSRWFCVVKKDGKSLRLVHSLEPLNAVTIAHSGLPPATEALADRFAGRSCGTTLDLYVGYDQRLLDPESRDYTTFQTPFGALRLTTLPMGWTNSVPIFHDDVTFILKEEIPQVTQPYIDDVPICGPPTRYEIYDDDAKLVDYERIPENSGIRRFVWEHLQDVVRVLQRIKHVGGAVSGKKAFIAQPEFMVVGHKCTYEGRRPDELKVSAIQNWPPCKNVTEVRSFLGTAGVCRMFVKDYAAIATPLTRLTQKNTVFRWGDSQQEAMNKIKKAILNSPALKPINYDWNTPVVLAVDTSHIAVGFYIYQIDPETGKKNFARFNSIPLNGPERDYSQPKRELFGLKRALQACRYWLLGCRNLKIETDAAYIKGMLEHPDEGPNATINRWIEQILRYHFILVHIPGSKHGPDGLSRRPWAEGDSEYPYDEDEDYEIAGEGLKGVEYPYGDEELPKEFDDFKEEIDTRGGYFTSVVEKKEIKLAESYEDIKVECSQAEHEEILHQKIKEQQLAKYYVDKGYKEPMAVLKVEELLLPREEERYDEEILQDYPEQSEEAQAVEEKVKLVKEYLKIKSESLLENMKKPQKMRFKKYAARYFYSKNGRFYKRGEQGRHKLYVEQKDRMYMMKACHDSLGHRGVYATKALLEERFWWPELEKDVEWYIKTCHKCQERIMRYKLKPPQVTRTPNLFEVCHADTAHMPQSCGTYKFIIHARDSLSSWPEFRATTSQNAGVCATFLFEDVICRWGVVKTIVTDNARLWTKAAKSIEKRYGIQNITISDYNSPANGKIERYHLDLRELFIKATGDNLTRWKHFVPHVAWAERITVRKKFGCSPFFLVTGCEPLIPLDILEATFLIEYEDKTLSTEELIGLRAQALFKHQRHMEQMRLRVSQEKINRVLKYEEDNKYKIERHNFQRGDLVLMRNSRYEESKSNKMWPRYLGPLIVVNKRKYTYVLCEMNGATLNRPVADFRIIPYYARKSIKLPDNIHDFIDATPEQLKEIETAETRWGEPLGEEILFPGVPIKIRGETEEEQEQSRDLTHKNSDISDDSEEREEEEWTGVKTRRQRGPIPNIKSFLQVQPAIYNVHKGKPEDHWYALGCHIRIDNFLDNAVLEAARIGARSFALFLKPDKICHAPPLLLDVVERFRNYMTMNNFDSELVLPHGSYFINLANPDKTKRTNSLRILLDDLKRCGKLGLTMYNLHPGSTTERPIPTEKGLARSIEYIAEGINTALRLTAARGNKVTILLENMAGHGATVGGRFEHLAAIIERIKDKSRIGVCFDTCHAYAAGYDISTPSGWEKTLAEFDRIVGANYLKAFHLNDSQMPLNSRRDRHQNLGLGMIGIQPFMSILNNPRFRMIPLILETPNYDNVEIWKQELGIWNEYCETRQVEPLKLSLGKLLPLVETARDRQLEAREARARLREKLMGRKTNKKTTNNEIKVNTGTTIDNIDEQIKKLAQE